MGDAVFIDSQKKTSTLSDICAKTKKKRRSMQGRVFCAEGTVS